ncbi:uncharacterized protein K460DRAFT_409633 [Cucurbitaria berberidis CBS 394.84]|uniref:C3H1-type domain-containing protein n=1 Tax=Cucurbitaria berberidis CBS 394.84 TaxID=1168544 RepID=A0A9P4GBJ3_9PLEO|nr:uncharacterized protein K460DRAFT_409633 [Cucurbitaria berberidis CBS 394.84]KAF1842215.1 hypothetical protein K460DRAFT_409633 [Cucurbitaria berberidis CBS 394.84]
MIGHSQKLPIIKSIDEILSELSVRPRSQSRLAASNPSRSPVDVELHRDVARPASHREAQTATVASMPSQLESSTKSTVGDISMHEATPSESPLGSSHVSFNAAIPAHGAQSSVISKRQHLVPERIPYLEKLPIIARAPRTAGNLLKLSERVIHALKHLQDPHNRENDFKLNPVRYGSTFDKDLGLCYEAFFTYKACRFGTFCKWRHDSLTDEEKAWITELRASHALAWIEECYHTPETPALKDWYATQVIDEEDDA